MVFAGDTHEVCSSQRHRPRPPTTRSAKSAQSLHPGLRGWRELRRRRCHHGTCRKNFSARASCRCRSAGILAAPEQQQPTLAGARNSSTTCSKASFMPIRLLAKPSRSRVNPLPEHNCSQVGGTTRTTKPNTDQPFGKQPDREGVFLNIRKPKSCPLPARVDIARRGREWRKGLPQTSRPIANIVTPCFLGCLQESRLPLLPSCRKHAEILQAPSREL